MIKVLFSFVLILLFSGCIGMMSPDDKIKAHEKAFNEEDSYILFALRSEQVKDYKSASSLFDILHKKSGKNEYLYRSLQNDLLAQQYERLVLRVDEILGDTLEDLTLVRMKVVALLQLHRLEDAKKLALKLVEQSNIVDDYILVSDIYVEQKKFDTAVKYLESAYIKDYSEKILDKISIILYVNLQRKKDAIAQLETHTRVYGCSQLICSRLIGFYSNENNIEGLLSTSLRLYKIDPSEETIKRIIQIYAYKKDYMKLITFLEDSKSDDELLLQLYVNAKNYTKASILAEKLYTKLGNVDFLAQSAVFEYQACEDKNSKDMQNRVIKKLKKALDIKEIPLYLNYLGYLMIDYEIDVKEGMSYVEKALLFEPNSAFFLDSLAWGYYKLGNCKKADIIIKKVVELEGGDDEEVITHLKAIDKCIKQKTKKGKTKK